MSESAEVIDELKMDISELVSDDGNARLHTPRNIGVIVDSLQENGAGRSIVIDEHNKVLCGNGVVEAAGQIEMRGVRVIEADGNEIIAVRRRGLTEEQKTRLALADNRANELSGWNKEILADLNEQQMLEGLFDEAEINRLLSSTNPPDDFKSLDGSLPTDYCCPRCGHAWSGKAK